LFFVHSEASLDYDQFTTKDSVAKARSYIDRYREDLERAEIKYGVDKNVVAAILLVETRLGKYTGRSPILNTLATMASLSDPIRRETLFQHISSNPKRLPRDKFEKKADRKSRWAYDQLKAFIEYSNQEKIDPFSIYGSYAGAFGIAQFMPTSIVAYAVDGDGDGRIDLFTHADSIASAANYLKQFGWKPGISRKKAEKAVHAYNRSSYYVNAVLTIVDKLGK
jgi:membrane-bound lytic murein transglycosylase B